MNWAQAQLLCPWENKSGQNLCLIFWLSCDVKNLYNYIFEEKKTSQRKVFLSRSERLVVGSLLVFVLEAS